MSEVISQIGKDVSADGLAILGVCEIENRTVLEDLVAQPSLKDKNYKIIHFDSYDFRGIDLRSVVSIQVLLPYRARPIPVNIYNGTEKIFTRDILYVEGNFWENRYIYLVNHWPSRRGGESTTIRGEPQQRKNAG